MANVYTPVVRGFLVGCGLYYGFITLSHPFFESGTELVILGGLAALSTVMALFLWLRLGRGTPSLRTLELAATCTQALFLLNVTTYLVIHFEPMKLIYYVLMALVFATTAPTLRTAYMGVFAAFVGLVIMAQRADEDLIGHYAYMGIAGAFAAIGMATVMRGAVNREIQARIKSDALFVEAEAANRAKSAFLATISHEIRTPLNGVLGMAQVMAREELSSPQRNRLEIIQDSANSLMTVINDVLDISKIEAGKLDIHLEPFSLSAFARGLESFYGVLVRERGLQFEVILINRAGDLRLGDEARLRQIAFNFLSNALKFTPTGRISVVIEADEHDLVCAVHDSGPGIPADQQQAIFDKFTQVDNSTTRTAGGTGLGLAICRELAGLLGGEVSLASFDGIGSCFSLRIPAPVVADAPDADRADRAVEASSMAARSGLAL